MTKIYKVRRKSDGKFSTGSSRPKFVSTGRVWNSLDLAFNHVKYNSSFHYDDYFNLKDFEIVEFEVTEKEVYDVTKVEVIKRNETLD